MPLEVICGCRGCHPPLLVECPGGRCDWVYEVGIVRCRRCRRLGTVAQLLRQVEALDAAYQIAGELGPDESPEAEIRRAALDRRGQP